MTDLVCHQRRDRRSVSPIFRTETPGVGGGAAMLLAGDATAESCSGGLIAHRITNVAGSSSYFLGGIVSYSNDAKTGLLGVDRNAISTHGAVSEEVAGAMAQGARDRFSADIAVGVTGIAGPGGGTREKPVGLVFIAVASPSGTVLETCHFDGDREAVKERTSEKALRMILEQIV